MSNPEGSQFEGNQFDRRETTFETAGPITPVMGHTAVVAEDRIVAAPVAPAVVERVVVQQVPVAPVQVERVRTASTRRFALDAIIAAAVGVVLLIIGLLAVTRAGFDGPMATPVVKVLGFTHTTSLGLIEIVVGLFLLVVGATAERSGAIFMGTVLGIAAFVGAIQATSFHHSLALQSGFAWLLVVAAVAVIVSALAMPRFLTRSTVVQTLN